MSLSCLKSCKAGDVIWVKDNKFFLSYRVVLPWNEKYQYIMVSDIITNSHSAMTPIYLKYIAKIQKNEVLL